MVAKKFQMKDEEGGGEWLGFVIPNFGHQVDILERRCDTIREEKGSRTMSSGENQYQEPSMLSKVPEAEVIQWRTQEWSRPSLEESPNGSMGKGGRVKGGREQERYPATLSSSLNTSGCS